MVICLERDADLHMAQLMPLPLTVSCFSKIHIGFAVLVPAHPGSPGKRAVKRVRVCVCGPLLANAPQLLRSAITQGSHGAQHPYRLQCNASDEKAWCQQDIRTFLAPSPGRSRWPSPAPPMFSFFAFCC